MNLTERFINYTKFDTQSSEESQSVPSTPKQLLFAEYLKKELISEGLSDVELDDKGYLYATLKGNIKGVPTIGFISHYDTSPDCSGANIKAHIVNNYQGGDILLSEDVISSPTKFPELLNHVGEDLIVTDGHTLLGADDKAGIAEIVQAMCYLRDHKEIPHGDIRIAFNPDEEIGMGAHHFDVEKFGCQWAYTMDGGDVGGLEYENFNAASAVVTVRGFSVHPGEAKDVMVNAQQVAIDYHQSLPQQDRPEHTAGHEGFYHLTSMMGQVSLAKLGYIVRDHDLQKFEQRKQTMRALAEKFNRQYGPGTVTVQLSDTYYNMLEKIRPHWHLIENARKAIQKAGLTPVEEPVRGGTDGAMLSFKGLPCPNLGTGGFNFHGVCECITAEKMDKAVEILLGLAEIYKG